MRRRSDLLDVIVESTIVPLEGYTDLTWSILCKDFEKVRAVVLNPKGVNINEHDGYGNTPLIMSVLFRDIKTLDFLLKKGAVSGIDYIDKKAQTALLIAAKNNLFDMVELLIYYGANPNVVCVSSSTALLWAVFNDNFDMTKLLLDNGADKTVEKVDFLGRTPLCWARNKKNTAIEELLFDYIEPPSLDEHDKVFYEEDNLRLVYAVRCDNFHEAKRLLDEEGAADTIDEKDCFDLTALDWARRNKNNKMEDLLFDYIEPPSPLEKLDGMLSITLGDVDAIPERTARLLSSYLDRRNRKKKKPSRLRPSRRKSTKKTSPYSSSIKV